MAAAATDYFIKVTPTFSTTIGSPGVAAADTDVFPLTSVADLPTDTAIELVINRVTTADPDTPTNNYETIRGVVSGSNVIDCVRGVEGTAQGWSAGVVVEYLQTGDIQNRMVTGLLVQHAQTGVHSSALVTSLKASGAVVNTGTSDITIVTPKAIADSNVAFTTDLTNYSNLYAPQGFLINGKIVPSVASNNLTVAIKGMDGNDPSATNPVYCRIGDTVRSITAALSVTKNAATNWFNSGAAELATKEIDYFVYLGYNATDGVVIGFARIPYGTKYGDFSATTTAETYCAISTISNAAATDYYELIGRFAATLSAGAGYTWSVPTYTAINLIQKPIYETRLLDYVGTVTSGSGSPTTIAHNAENYKIVRKTLFFVSDLGITNKGTAGGAMTSTLPFTHSNTANLSFAGRENGSTGKTFSVSMAGAVNTILETMYDNTTPFVDTARYPLTGFYEI